eukprot:TRINITY_DN36905_c0_g1_i1.p1 TRINITY_DN36905_c0_g1~~TRINITY_DN36905_c0_g1_i1.p1  ORF type:complete len:505 (+),score=125.11 TRINITY_DN36905_c0_g1_i1:50-1516(+)
MLRRTRCVAGRIDLNFLDPVAKGDYFEAIRFSRKNLADAFTPEYKEIRNACLEGKLEMRELKGLQETVACKAIGENGELLQGLTHIMTKVAYREYSERSDNGVVLKGCMFEESDDGTTLTAKERYAVGAMDPTMTHCVVTNETSVAVVPIRNSAGDLLTNVTITPHGHSALKGGLITFTTTVPSDSVSPCPSIVHTYACTAALAVGRCKRALLDIFAKLQNVNEPELYYTAVPSAARLTAVSILLNNLYTLEGEFSDPVTVAAVTQVTAATLLCDITAQLSAVNALQGVVDERLEENEMLQMWNREMMRNVATAYINEKEGELSSGVPSVFYGLRQYWPLLWRMGAMVHTPRHCNSQKLHRSLIKHRAMQVAYLLIHEMKDAIVTPKADPYEYWLRGCRGNVASLTHAYADITLFNNFSKYIQMQDPTIKGMLTSYFRLFSISSITKNSLWYVNDQAIPHRLLPHFDKQLRHYTEDLQRDVADFVKQL